MFRRLLGKLFGGRERQKPLLKAFRAEDLEGHDFRGQVRGVKLEGTILTVKTEVGFTDFYREAGAQMPAFGVSEGLYHWWYDDKKRSLHLHIAGAGEYEILNVSPPR